MGKPEIENPWQKAREALAKIAPQKAVDGIVPAQNGMVPVPNGMVPAGAPVSSPAVSSYGYPYYQGYPPPAYNQYATPYNYSGYTSYPPPPPVSAPQMVRVYFVENAVFNKTLNNVENILKVMFNENYSRYVNFI